MSSRALISALAPSMSPRWYAVQLEVMPFLHGGRSTLRRRQLEVTIETHDGEQRKVTLELDQDKTTAVVSLPAGARFVRVSAADVLLDEVDSKYGWTQELELEQFDQLASMRWRNVR